MLQNDWMLIHKTISALCEKAGIVPPKTSDLIPDACRRILKDLNRE